MLGGLILYWMYRDFDFKTVADTLMHGMNWTWMLLSFPFGILAQMFRGWRWHLTLDLSVRIHAHRRASTRYSSRMPSVL